MTDIQAAIGRVQLKKAEDAIKHRSDIAVLYKSRLKDKVSYFSVPSNVTRKVHSIFPIKVNNAEILCNKLNASGIDARRFFPPMDTQYRDKSTSNCPNSKKLYDTVVLLPIGNSTTLDEIDQVCNTLESCL
jgi:dTDP-4-amino-4,6-dideoxygalactose transaminase